ncbi:MAG: ribonuclease III, partial [Chloroflexi bacterium]
MQSGLRAKRRAPAAGGGNPQQLLWVWRTQFRAGVQTFQLMDFNQLQARLGMQFHNPALLEQALTHSSYRNENPECKADNERLEFLGDAVLDLVTARYLYEHHPALHEGELTRLRAALVRTEQLAELARRFELGKALRVGRGEAETGGRARDTLLCCAFEAILGALYLDSGEAAVCAWVEPLLAQQSAIILTSQA